MATKAHAETSKGAGERLAPGSTFAGRFTIECLRYLSGFAEVYQAIDTRTGKPCSVHLFHEAIAKATKGLDRLSVAITSLPKTAAAGVALPKEFVGGANPFVVTEFVDGQSLRQLLSRTHETGAQGFSPRAARNLLLQVLEALETMPAHGALSLDAIAVDKSGHVTVTDFGMWPLIGDGDKPPVRERDVLAIGLILQELLTGNSTPEVDQLLAKLLPKPAPEYRDLKRLKAEVDKSLMAKSTLSPDPSSQVKRKSLAFDLGTGGRKTDEHSSPSVLLDKEERWLVSKDKLDYGPFAAQQIILDIRADQIQPGHLIVDSQTGTRVPCERHPLFQAEVAEAKQKRDDKRRTAAEITHAKQEKRRGFTLYGLIVLGVVGLGGGAYFLVAALRSEGGKKQEQIASLSEASLEPTIGGSTIEDEVRPRKRPKNGKGQKSGPRGNTDDWDAPLDLGDVSEGDEGGDERLSNAQINPVVKKHGAALGKCLQRSGARQANIRILIRGNGKVTYVSVNGDQNSGLATCVRGVMASAQFPTFNGVRTRAAFDMSL
jgi:hypothetical protein